MYTKLNLQPFQMVKNITKRYAMQKKLLKPFFKQGWYNEYPSTTNRNFSEVLTCGLPQKIKDFPNAKANVFLALLNLPSLLNFPSLVIMVDSEGIILGRTETQELSLS